MGNHNDSEQPSHGFRIPADPDIERALLGAAFLSGDAARIAVGVPAADWLTVGHAAIASAIAATTVDGLAADPLLVAAAVDQVHGIALGELHAMFVTTPSVSSAPRYAEVIAVHAHRRRLVALADELGRAAMDNPHDIAAVVERIRAEVES